MEAYQQLEQEFGEWAQVSNTVACSSGTSAIQLAIEALRLPKGSTVLIPEFCMIACARAVTMAGLKIETIDCHSETLNICMDTLPERGVVQANRNKISALLVVHTYGRKVTQTVFDWADDYRIPVIEDLAEAHGVQPDSRSVAACWSFYKNKIITGGHEGGIVAFKEKEAATLARSLRSMGFTEAHDFIHNPGGFNCRMSNLHAEAIINGRIGLDVMKAHGDQWRQDVVDVYDRFLPDGYIKQPKRNANWVYDIRLPNDSVLPLDHVVKVLKNDGARHSFKPVRMQPEYDQKDWVGTKTAAYQASLEVFYLPITPDLEDEDIRQICNRLELYTHR